MLNSVLQASLLARLLHRWSPLLYLFVCGEAESHTVAQAQVHWLRAAFASQVQAIHLPQLPEKLELQVHTTMPSQLLVFVIETKFHHIGQAGLELWPQVICPPQPCRVLGLQV